MNVPAPVAPFIGVAVPLSELAVGVALLSASARLAALAAIAMLTIFSIALVGALAQGRAPECHCFGRIGGGPIGWRAVLRNAALIGLAGVIAVTTSLQYGRGIEQLWEAAGGPWWPVVAFWWSRGHRAGDMAPAPITRREPAPSSPARWVSDSETRREGSVSFLLSPSAGWDLLLVCPLRRLRYLTLNANPHAGVACHQR